MTAASLPGVVLVGNPNVGKSALFGALTGAYVTVSNYPGTTVEVSEGSAVVAGRKLLVRDTPGSASLIPYSEDERVTRDMLLSADGSAVILVGDAKNLERALTLALEVAETGLPFVLCLNMSDEARSRGISVDAAALAARLGVDVVETVAVRREGVSQLAAAIERARPGGFAVTYPDVIERAVAAAEPLMPAGAYARRSLALAALAGDQTLTPWLRARLSDAALSELERIRTRLARIYRDDLGYVIQEARLRAAGQIAREVVSRRALPPASTRAAVRVLDRATTHPVWGVPILLAALYLSYLFVGVFGAKTLVDLLENGLFGKWISPAATRFAAAVIPWPIVRDFFVGQYGLVTMALAYSLALVLPIVGTFFIAFGVLEDSGYLPRLAVMVNRIFKSMGLNGKAVLPMVLGLGCDTMATLTTRILETPKERLIVILLLALGVPCSAQLTVILAMLGGLSPLALAIWAFVVLAVLFAVGQARRDGAPGAHRRLRARAAAAAPAASRQPRGQDARPHRVVPARGRAALRPRHRDPVRRRPPPPARGRRAGRAADRLRRARASGGDRDGVRHRVPAARLRRGGSLRHGAARAHRCRPVARRDDHDHALHPVHRELLHDREGARLEDRWRDRRIRFSLRGRGRRVPEPVPPRGAAAPQMKPEEAPFVPLPAHPESGERLHVRALRQPLHARRARLRYVPDADGVRARALSELRIPVPALLADRRGVPRPLRPLSEEIVMLHPDLADQDIEEVAEEIWILAEQGLDRAEDLRASSKIGVLDAALSEMERRGLARVAAGRVALTSEGRELARRQVRRHRLAEVLFTTVLEVRDENAVDRTACVMEHVLGAGLADAICSFLGHPKACPHGKPIPAGPCCRELSQTIEPLVQPLDRLPAGTESRIVYIVPRERERLSRLTNMGIVPGARIRVQQKVPAFVLALGETTLAVDPAIAAEIYVKKI